MIDTSGREAIKVENFTEHVALLKASKDRKLIEEFESLDFVMPFTQHAARLLCNKPKNRYKNIAACKFFKLHHWQKHINIFFRRSFTSGTKSTRSDHW